MSEDVLHRPSDVAGVVIDMANVDTANVDTATVDTANTARRHALEVHVDRVDGVLVISPVGEIDAATGGLLLEALIAAISTGETQLIVDLDEARIIDSTASSIFLSASRATAAVDGRLLIVVGAGRHDVIGPSQLNDSYAVYPSVAVAVDAVKNE